MEVPLEIGFHQVDSSEWIETEIRNRVEELDRLYDRLTACRVRVVMPHKQHQTGNVPEVHIELSVPGRNLVVSRGPHKPYEKYSSPAPELRTVIREAFDAAERQLKEYKDKVGGDVSKPHDFAVHGQVSQYYPEEEHGFILTNTGTQLYFHRNSVLNNEFEALSVGDTVHYVEDVGDTGPIAKKVRKATPHQEF